MDVRTGTPPLAGRFGRRSFLLALPAPLLLAQQPQWRKHVLIYRKEGRFGGWPANHGIWSWGNEILVGFSAAYFKKRGPNLHQADSDKPEVPAFARSADGGETWTVWEEPQQMLPRWEGKPGAPLREAMDFSQPGFAMTMRFNDVDTGPTIYWYTLDKGASWKGPFEFPSLGLKGIAGRPDYIVLGKHEAMVFQTAAKSDGEEGRPFCARTRDGGVSWEFVSYIGAEPDGFGIMPSTVRLADGALITTIRRRESGRGPRPASGVRSAIGSTHTGHPIKALAGPSLRQRPTTPGAAAAQPRCCTWPMGGFARPTGIARSLTACGRGSAATRARAGAGKSASAKAAKLPTLAIRALSCAPTARSSRSIISTTTSTTSASSRP